MCAYPIRVEGNTVPCGKCFKCKRRKINGWVFRLKQEAESSISAFFLTLTYNEEHVRKSFNGYDTLDKTDLQKFFKRLRKLNKGIKIKYYAVGEYGKEGRPHWHIILFNADIETIERAWRLDDKLIGYIKVGSVTEQSINYTLKYIEKPRKVPEHELDDREVERSFISQGMGLSYITESRKKWHKSNILENAYIPLYNGKKIAMPRYFQEKIYTKLQREGIKQHVVNQSIKKYQYKNNVEKSKLYTEEIRINDAKQYKFEQSERKEKL